ncbi:hypothetical protein COLO4_18774 [Corchorus olitorius]|uniref:Calcineurin-like phosphoesterase domain-containing protein n=1 Tax=Corchorus olitorius TaxID=93759 RepID=A0A1R3J7T6_9ROSI|nr:hypothetical protein COLO4_18774 [Corchorus olitorius]
MKRSTSWRCTLATQLSLCFALYVVLNLSQPQKFVYNDNSRPLDLYFISVRGGFRALKEQTHLLKLMENVAKAYDVKFVVNISELGKGDPLIQNVTGLSPLMNLPWYTTGVSESEELGCFLQQIKLPQGRTLDLISLPTASLQVDICLPNPAFKDKLLNWLTRTLEATVSSWRIVVGLHPLVSCEAIEEQMVVKEMHQPLHHMFTRFGVNVYLSQQGCYNYVLQDSVAYIGNPGLTEENSHLPSASANETYLVTKDMTNGFLLHRVSLLEMALWLAIESSCFFPSVPDT